MADTATDRGRAPHVRQIRALHTANDWRGSWTHSHWHSLRGRKSCRGACTMRAAGRGVAPPAHLLTRAGFYCASNTRLIAGAYLLPCPATIAPQTAVPDRPASPPIQACLPRSRLPSRSAVLPHGHMRHAAQTGVTAEGLRITALPAASAGATFCASMVRGEFQGVIATTTP